MKEKELKRVKDAFSNVLRVERAKRKISQEALSLNSGVDRRSISFFETGKSQPTLLTLFKLAGALDIPLSTIILKVEEKLA